jgi:ribosomal protein S6
MARQETGPAQLKQLQEKYSKIGEKNEGEIVKLESWGLKNLSFLIKKNKKGNYIHFKIKAKGKTISELEKTEKIDKNLLRNLTVRVKQFDLKTENFNKNEDKESEQNIKNKKEKKKK